MKKNSFIEIVKDTLYSVIAGLVVAIAFHIFSSKNGFVPGGLSGIASIIAHYTGKNMGTYLILLNVPIFILTFIFIEKKLGVFLAVYVAGQSIALMVFEDVNLATYEADNGNLIFASIAMGVLSGLGFSIQIKRHGSSGGTYAISSLIKRWNPAANIAWLSFAMDSCVVVLVLIAYGNTTFETAIEMAICTITNLFIADLVVDYCMQGSKEGYKFEIITDEPEALSTEIMKELRHGVTEFRVQGMYTHAERHMIVCIIRKRDLSKMMKLIKKYPNSFASFSRVNEVFGNFKK